jgi:hypothetical protein
VSTKKELREALEIVAEGARARISEDRKRKLFGSRYEQRMNAIQTKHRKWIGASSVQGIGVAAKRKRGRNTGVLAIVAFVNEKIEPAKLRDPVPRSFRLPGLGRIETDVWALGTLVRHAFPNRVRPAVPGCSIGHERLPSQGTLGLVVRKQDAADPHLYVLSNSHVLALSGLAHRGDAVVQPGRGDATGHRNDKIAELADWVKFDFRTKGFPNEVDAAIARVTRKKYVSKKMRVINLTPTRCSAVIKEGMKVHKVGRTTDDFGSRVLCAHAKVWIKHRKTKKTSAYIGFDDQVLCEPYASLGDSGSAVLNDKNEVIGLHAAGSALACSFNRIDRVFDLLKIKLA